MKKTSLLVLLVLGALPLFAQRNMDVLHYRYEIRLGDQHDTIRVRALITVQFLSPASTVVFDLAGRDAKGRGMLVTAAAGKAVGEMKQEGNKLNLSLTKPAGRGDTAQYSIDYLGVPADGLIISKNKYGRRTFFADNWPDRGKNWLACIDDPADKASVEFIVTAPLRYQVVANGIQVEESNLPGDEKRTHWKEEVPVSTKVMVIGVAEFAVQLAGLVEGCIPVYSWVYPEDREKGFFDYAQALEIMPYFTRNIGPYAYKKLANVESKTIFGGLENASTIFYSEKSITGKRQSEALLAHEIAHQWFGNMATEKTFAHLWLSEGFATYMTVLYMENKYGRDTARYMLREDRRQAIEFSQHNKSPVVDTNPDYMELLNPNSYQKAGWVLHMLRRQLGDSVFWKSIRRYYARYAGKTADTDDLRKVMEEVSGRSLEKFFRQWLFTPGIPHLVIDWKYDAKAKKVLLTVKQERTDFEFPLDIATRDAGGKMTVSRFQVSNQLEKFSIPVKEKPAALIADPELSLLFSERIYELK